MSTIEVADGFCLGFGGTNARTAHCAEGDITDFQIQPTPTEADELFRWTSQQILRAADQGANWAVAGFPGPVNVSEDSFNVGPFTNIPGLTSQAYDLKSELVNADPAIGDILEQGFRLVAVNDGDLAAHAAAAKIGDGEYDKVADVILGTGVGGAVVCRGDDGIYHSSGDPFEIGHIVLGEVPTETFENMYSGCAIQTATGIEAQALPHNHPVWDKLGRGVGKLATTMSLMAGAELVVPSGSVGVHRFRDYQESMYRFMEQYYQFGSPAQKNFDPLIARVPTDLADQYELFGAEGVMRDALSQKVAATT